MSTVLENVKKFLLKERWDYGFELNLETSIQNDLKIFGDDASEILTKFCNEFNINSEKFNFDEYFRPEFSWIDILKKKKKYKNLTIGDLVKAIENGYL